MISSASTADAQQSSQPDRREPSSLWLPAPRGVRLLSPLGTMEPVATVSASELQSDPSARLWALIYYLAENPPAQQLSEFREFWLAYQFDAEVNNGGHLQYFQNRGMSNVPATLQALAQIGAQPHALLLSECWRQVQDNPVLRVGSLEEYSALASQRSFSAEDKSYYALPSVIELLEHYYGQLLERAVAISA